MTIQIALYQTDIAQNFGAIARTTVCLGAGLHVIEPLGFVWNDAKMRRAGMDYLERADITRHLSWPKFADNRPKGRLVALTKFGATSLPDFTFQSDDILLFGRESAGLPEEVVALCDARVRIPMRAEERSLNLAQSCAIALYQALAQTAQLPLK